MAFGGVDCGDWRWIWFFFHDATVRWSPVRQAGYWAVQSSMCCGSLPLSVVFLFFQIIYIHFSHFKSILRLHLLIVKRSYNLHDTSPSLCIYLIICSYYESFATSSCLAGAMVNCAAGTQQTSTLQHFV